MTEPPLPPPSEPPQSEPPPEPSAAVPAVPAPVATPPVPAPPVASPRDRLRAAVERRGRTDYVFAFWTALGWSFLTCSIAFYYFFFQLVRRSRDHAQRRLEVLEATNELAWERALATGQADELRPVFERIAGNLEALRAMTRDFRDPTAFTVLAVVLRGIMEVIAYVLLDRDLVHHDYREGAVENDLAYVLGRVGVTVPAPDPARLHQEQSYAARIVVTLLTCGIYFLWWTYDVMRDLNRHFEQNWAWEDAVVQALGDAP